MTAKTYKPLAGVRVLSFELAFALPAATRALYDLGAEVVRVARPDGNNFGRYVSVSDGVFLGKPCVAIDLTKEEGRKIAFDLALKADVVSNNFRPGVLEKYGLGAAALRTRKPELVWLQLSGYGTPGPFASYPAYGPSTEAAGGMNRLLVDEGEVPIRNGSGVFSDQLAGRYAALAIVSALEERSRSGRGATIDLSMTECITHLLGSIMVEALRTGQTPRAEKNRSEVFAPQGVYPCRGRDEWIAITIKTDRSWRAFAGLVGKALDSQMPVAQRHRNHDEIDRAIADWTRNQDKNELASLLQREGVAAGPVRTVQDAALDPQLRARKSLQMVRHQSPMLGHSAHPHPPLPWRVANRKKVEVTDYRNSGQDNESVLARWLGLAPARVRKLEQQGVLFNEGPVEITARKASGELYDPDFATKLDLPK